MEANSSVSSWRLLADRMASCSSLGCRVRLRPFLARVHDGRLGHAAHSDAENFMPIILRPRALLVSVQRTLWRPRGQLTSFFSPSTEKLATMSKPSLALACQALSR